MEEKKERKPNSFMYYVLGFQTAALIIEIAALIKVLVK